MTAHTYTYEFFRLTKEQREAAYAEAMREYEVEDFYDLSYEEKQEVYRKATGN